MGNTVQLKKNGQKVYPITDSSCVIGLEDRPIMKSIYAWDGTTTPVVANIPAGVTVEYNTTTYTGTLAASGSTSGYIYLVYNTTSGEYDRYGTDATGGSYTWKAMGDTTIQSPTIVDDLVTNDATKALSAKQGKVLNDELSELELEVSDISDKMPMSGKNITGTIDRSSSNPGYGKYIKQDGTVASYSGYMISNPIALEAGDRFVSSARAGSTQIFAKYLGDYSTFTPIAGYFVGGNTTYPIDWVADEDCQVVVCGETNSLGEYNITSQEYDYCASLGATILGWILAESFTASSITRDSSGAVSSAVIAWPDGKAGTIAITRNGFGSATSVVAVYDGTTYTMTINRDSENNVTSYSIA